MLYNFMHDHYDLIPPKQSENKRLPTYLSISAQKVQVNASEKFTHHFDLRGIFPLAEYYLQ